MIIFRLSFKPFLLQNSLTTRKKRLSSTVLTEDAGYIYQDIRYDALGRVWRVSNPYRTGTPVWTETRYDALGRVTEVIEPDGALTATDYASNRTTVMDPAAEADPLGDPPGQAGKRQSVHAGRRQQRSRGGLARRSE